MADYSASGGEAASGPEPAPRPDAVVKPRWARDAQVRTLCESEAHQQATEVSERQAAAAAGVARSTLRHWRQRQSDCDLAPEVAAFFESPVGLEWLHRLGVAAHLVITLLGCGGVRLVCRFLELTGLSAVVASSYGAQQSIAMALEAAVVAFGEAERTRLGAAMPSRTITLRRFIPRSVWWASSRYRTSSCWSATRLGARRPTGPRRCKRRWPVCR